MGEDQREFEAEAGAMQGGRRPTGVSPEALSRELGVEIYRLEKWRDKGLCGIDAALKELEGNPVQAGLDAAMKRIE